MTDRLIPAIDPGPVYLAAHCPGCGAQGILRVSLGVKLTRVAEDEPGDIRATLRQTPITHDCRTRQWPRDDGTVPGQMALTPELEP